ncbi:MAG: hypothetical protein ACTSXQ_06440 [Alphaproteobacteria bacterium]
MGKFILFLIVCIFGALAYFFAGDIFEGEGYGVEQTLDEISVKLDEVTISVIEPRGMPTRTLSFRFIVVAEKGYEGFITAEKAKIQDALFRYLFNVYQYDVDQVLRNRKRLKEEVNKVVLKIMPPEAVRDVKIKYVNEKKH